MDTDPRPSQIDLSLFKRSLARCTAKKNFLDRFYQRLLAASPDVALLFRDTDLVRQKLLLKRSLSILMMFALDEQLTRATLDLQALAEVHHRRRIAAPLYDLWLDCMLATVRECDPRYDAAVERAWRLTLAPGIAFMKGGAHLAWQEDEAAP